MYDWQVKLFSKEKLYLAGSECFYTNGYTLWDAMRRKAEYNGFGVTMPSDNQLDMSSPDLRDHAKAIFQNCANCMNESTAILVDLENFRGAEPDGGSIYELGMAYARGMRCYAYTRDKRALTWKVQGAHLNNGIVCGPDNKPLPYAEDAIYRRISDITISMKSTDHLKMPELVSTECEVQLSDSERSRYEDLKQELILQLPDGEVTAANAASLTGKLSQLANGAIYADTGEVIEFHNRKLDALEDIIEAANEKPLLVAYWFRHDLSRIKNRFNVREIKTSRDIADWNAGKIPVAVIHPASAGHGLNLQAGGSTLVWFGLTWSLELYQQTNARLWRQGQESGTVVIQHIITKGTIDERIVKALSKKEMTQTALIDAVKADLEVV